MNKYTIGKCGLLVSAAVLLAGCADLAVRHTERLLLPDVPVSEIVGFVAGFGTTFAAFPDLIAMIRRRSSAGMNPRMAMIMGCFQVLWIYYGLLILSRPVVLWNTLAVLINFFVVGAYYYYARREAKQQALATSRVQTG